MLLDAPKRNFSTNSQSSGQPKNDTKTLFSTLHPLSLVIFATVTMVAFVLLHNSRFNFYCYTQPDVTPTQKSARKWRRPCNFHNGLLKLACIMYKLALGKFLACLQLISLLQQVSQSVWMSTYSTLCCTHCRDNPSRYVGITDGMDFYLFHIMLYPL